MTTFDLGVMYRRNDGMDVQPIHTSTDSVTVIGTVARDPQTCAWSFEGVGEHADLTAGGFRSRYDALDAFYDAVQS